MYKLLIILAVISCQKKVEMKEVLRPVKTTTIKASDGLKTFVSWSFSVSIWVEPKF